MDKNRRVYLIAKRGTDGREIYYHGAGFGFGSRSEWAQSWEDKAKAEDSAEGFPDSYVVWRARSWMEFIPTA